MSRTGTSSAAPTAAPRRTSNVCRSVPGPRGGGRLRCPPLRDVRVSGSSRNDKEMRSPGGCSVSLPPYAGTVLRLDRVATSARLPRVRRETPGRPEHEPEMERPPTPDEARTAALDERPTPRRNRRPRFGSRSGAGPIPEYEPPQQERERHPLDDATSALPRDYEPDGRHPPRQLVLDR